MEALLSKRRAIKGQLTRLETIINDNTPESFSVTAVKTYQERADRVLNDLEIIQEGIIIESPAEAFNQHEAEYNLLIGRAEEISIYFNHLLSQKTAITQQPGRAEPTADIRLPKMELPTFSGSHVEWFSFHDLFTATVHNSSLSGAQKLQYLKMSLRGEAAVLVKSILVTDENYTEAWNILLNRYNNTREIIDAHLKRLFSQPAIKEESSSALRCLIDTTTECIRSLKVLKEPVEYWDAVLLYIVKEKIDQESRKHWELSLTGTSRPTFQELTLFLEQRARALMSSQASNNPQKTKIVPYTKKNTLAHHGSVKEGCSICKESHAVYKCPTLLKASTDDRWKIVKQHSLCYNCLRSDHQLAKCKSGSCRKCPGNHNTLLHQDTRPSGESATNSNGIVTSLVSREPCALPQVVLATAIIEVQLSNGEWATVRALLDSGSQASFIDEQCYRKLQLKRRRLIVAVGGIGATGIGTSRGSVELIMKPRTGSLLFNVNALILRKITADLPTHPINVESWAHIKNLRLADSTFHRPGPIDVLLGADVYMHLLRDGVCSGQSGTAGAFNTVFGWVICGPIESKKLLEPTQGIKVHTTTIDEQLAKFWELEEICPERALTANERRCEENFVNTYSRNEEGRYIVRLPLKCHKEFGDSRKHALRRFTSIEKRLQTTPSILEQYRNFMEEYIKLGHMTLVPEEANSSHNAFYLPHHPVFKESSSTTKLRVVFDASAKSANGTSLNDVLLVGPKTQEDLIMLLLRFRLYAVAITADIAKMYRQVLVHPHDTHLQRIIWRSNPSQPIRDYELRTVTYGTASAPFLATRVLKQLSLDVQSKYPLAAQALSNDFYVDDLMTGSDTTEMALQLQRELLQATNEAGFSLRKWASNDPALLAALSEDLREIQGPLNFDNDESIKTLGLRWTPAADYFSFIVNRSLEMDSITKRAVLSETAKVFDPLGLLSPVIIQAKLLLQELWRLKLDWDDHLPETLARRWKTFQSELPEIENLAIQRHMSQRHSQEIGLQGFCDASEKAYAAVVYLRTKNEDGVVQVHLIAAKTKVALLKQVSLPKLELCGAVLLIRLMKLIRDALKITIPEIHCYTDSMTVLGWLASPPQRWRTFIANRVCEVQDTVPEARWHHVKGENNPADCASRGVSAIELLNHSLWWHGPSWLLRCPEIRQSTLAVETEDCLLEVRPTAIFSNHGTIDTTLLDNCSSLSKILHVTAYVQRFGNNARTIKANRITGPLTSTEIESALKHWIKIAQRQVFNEEIHCLAKTQPIPSKSKLLSLNPFIDPSGILRVGGRIRNAKINTDQVHPMILPRRSKLTDLIINHEHTRHLHAGAQLLITVLQRRYWIFGIRDAVRFHIRRCVSCVRQKATALQQQMGDLPAARVNPARAFLKCGVDYAGPFSLRFMKGRGQRTFKAYMALFVCFTTRAIHLEIVSDMTADAFLAALKRFTARRGKSSDIYSDCGTNFIGANREMREFLKVLSTSTSHEKIKRWTSDEGIRWHFNPPSAPHFGGLWEAGVKSVKFHLKRVVGPTTLSYEEMSTLLCQIEACLNSRPLSAISTEPDSLVALTPGHFLIGDALTAIPEPDLTDVKTNRLSRWQMGQQLLQHFWRRWRNEYLSRLQQRPKWVSLKRNVQSGDLVIIKDEDLPPTKWKLGRVQEVHPGNDGCVRVVTLKTADRLLKRSVTKLCLLPLD